MRASIIQRKSTCRGRVSVPGFLFGLTSSRPNPEPSSPFVARFPGDLHLPEPLTHRRLGNLIATFSAASNNVGWNDARVPCIIQKLANKRRHHTVARPPSLRRAVDNRGMSKRVTLWRTRCGGHDMIDCGIPSALKRSLFQPLQERQHFLEVPARGIPRHLALHDDGLIGENAHYGDIDE
jgi:hypothetical protein